jgi:oxygen-dependent protoporphyrinogen oxidase
LAEYFVGNHRKTVDESLKSFATRRFGTETFERIIQPLVAGIYSARAEELSMQATMKRFLDLEQEHGGMIRAARAKRQTDANRQASGARYGMFVTPKHGMQSLVDALVQQLAEVNVRCEFPVREIGHNAAHWQINGDDDVFDAVVVTGNASAAASMLRLENGIVESLRSISFGSMIVVTVECELEDFKAAPQGFGCVIPEIENRNLIACSFASNKFAGRSGEGKMLLRCFVGGRNVDQWKDSRDEELIEMVAGEIKELLGFSPNTQPRYEVFRWLNCMPQYRIGHVELVAKIKHQTAEYPGLAVAGCSYDGVGIPACIASGKAAARKIGEYLAAK